MKNLLIVICLFMFVLATSLLVRADIARPKQVPTPAPEIKSLYSYLQVVPDAKATRARLQVKQSVFNQLNAGIQGTDSNNAIGSTATQTSNRTIVAGLLLFLSIAFAGVWIARTMRGKAGMGRGQKAAAAVLITVATIGIAAIITQGNAPPPSYSWRGLPTALAEGRSTGGEVVIEIVPDGPGDAPDMRLIVPLKKQNAKGEEE